MNPQSLRWDIFCRVVDNFGDAGVCWRLARTLVDDYHQNVRLIIDEPELLLQLCPTASQIPVDVVAWTASQPDMCDAEVVIEAFACELPERYLASMAERSEPPCWINLEYLSAEAWVEECHGLASPHPSLLLKKHFFFPGFSEKTGGILWGNPPVVRESFLSQFELSNNFAGITISFFAYDHVSADGALDAWRKSGTPVRCLIPPGKPRKLIEQSLGFELAAPVQQDNLLLIPIPFLSQVDYDQLLLACDLNFVRGEDSFVRAQWAGKPFVWQIYPQEENAHADKLGAFLLRYCAELPVLSLQSLQGWHAYWNQLTGSEIDHGLAWEMLVQQFPALQVHARRWAKEYHSTPDLAERLVRFVGKFRRLSV
jgi:uncharacterized repeat protein (TIGR03837 family)